MAEWIIRGDLFRQNTFFDFIAGETDSYNNPYLCTYI